MDSEDLVTQLFSARDAREAERMQVLEAQNTRTRCLHALLPDFWQTIQTDIVGMVERANSKFGKKAIRLDQDGAELRLSHPSYPTNDGFLLVRYNPDIPSIKANRKEFRIVLLDTGDYSETPVPCLQMRNGARVMLGDEANQVLSDFLTHVIR